jgi:uncharacterized protein
VSEDVYEPVGMLDELSLGECLRFLAGNQIGRIAVVVDDFPVVFPVNYRFVDRIVDGPILVVRARPDQAVGAGWSVLVRGLVQHVDAADLANLPFADPHPWAPGRDEWLVITPIAITGRRLIAGDIGWGFHPLGYL